MPWSTFLDAFTPVVLSRANYDRTRTKAHRLIGIGRDDTILPKLAPPGAAVLSVPDAPHLDVAVPAALAGAQPRILRQVIGVTFWGAPILGPAAAVRAVAPDVSVPVEGPFPLSLPNVWVVGRWVIAPPGWAAPLNRDGWVTDVAGLELVQEGWTPPPYPYSDEWWYDTDWGREEAVTFIPPFVLGQYGWEAAQVTELPEGSTVLVRLPEPGVPNNYIVGMPEPLEVLEHATSSGAAGGPTPLAPHGRYRSPAIVTGVGPRQRPIQLASGDWTGFYIDEKEKSWLAETWEKTLRTFARSAAGELFTRGVGAILTVFSGGLTAPLVQAGLSALSSAGGDRVAGQFTASETASLTTEKGGPFGGKGFLEDGSITALGGEGVGEVAGDVGLSPVDLVEEAALQVLPDAFNVAPVAAPEQTNEFLQAVGGLVAYVPIDQLHLLAFKELVLQAELRKSRRDALRVLWAERRAEVEAKGGAWVKVLQKVWDTLEAIGTAGLAPAVKSALSAAEAAFKLYNARELARIERDEELERARARAAAAEAELRALEALLAELEADLAARQAAAEASAAAGAARSSGPSSRTLVGILAGALGGAALLVGAAAATARSEAA